MPRPCAGMTRRRSVSSRRASSAGWSTRSYWKVTLLVGIDVAVDLLRGERALVEAGENELQLAWIGVDVADREDARRRRLELLGGINRHRFSWVETPQAAIGPSFIVRPKNGIMRRGECPRRRNCRLMVAAASWPSAPAMARPDR